MKKAIVIFSGYNMRAIVAICRYLTMNNCRAFIIAKDSQDPIYWTDYGKWVCYERKSLELEIEECKSYFTGILDLSNCKHALVMPTSESLNRFFLQAKEKFSSVHLPLVSLDLYEKISDKQSFNSICAEHKIEVPMLLNITKISFPCVAKRRNYSMAFARRIKPYLIFNQNDYEIFLQQENSEDFYFEEYIDGDSYYLMYCLNEKGEYREFFQKNLIQQYDGKSILAATNASINLRDISQQYLDLFKKLKFFGLIMVEIREFNGKFYMIEANPRFWGPIQFVVDNFPQLLDFFFVNHGIVISRGLTNGYRSDYFWFGGYVENRTKNQPIKFYNHTNNSTQLDDISIAKLIKSDVYLRKDTLEYFYKELNEMENEQN